MTFKLEKKHYYWIIVAVMVAAFAFSNEKMTVPMWGTIILFGLILVFAGDMMWESYKRQGKACILTSLTPEMGGHGVCHPYDILFAKDTGGRGGPTFMVFAQGGFIHNDVAPQGKDNFIVCCPEHTEDTVSALICHSKLKRVDYEQLPEYVQDELGKLRYFDPVMVKAKKNLWFGMTSKRDGSSTAQNLAAETRFLDQHYLINEYKNLLRDKDVTKPHVNWPWSRPKDQQVVLRVPNDAEPPTRER